MNNSKTLLKSRRNFVKNVAATVAATTTAPVMTAKAFAGSKTKSAEAAEMVEKNAFDYDGLEKEGAKEALLEERSMIFISMISENAKVESDEYGVSPVVGTQKSATGTQEFLNNSGAHVKCHVLDDVIVVPNSVYADEGTNGGPDGNAFINTAETSGSWVDQKLTAAAEANGVPRENIIMVFYIKNDLDGGGAWTNYGHNGYTIDTEIALKPENNRLRQQEIIGVHEMGRRITRTPEYASWDVPTNPDGSLMYDLRVRITDPFIPTKIETCGSAGASSYIRRIPDIMRDDVDGNAHTYQLFDHISQQWIEVPMGGRLWHETDWKWAIDKFTVPRVEIGNPTPPEANGESLDVPYLGDILIADLIANDPRATDIVIDGALPGFATRDSDRITFDWDAIMNGETGTSAFSYYTVDEEGTRSPNGASAMLTFKNGDGFTVDVAEIDAPTASSKIYPNPWDGREPLQIQMNNTNIQFSTIKVFDTNGKQIYYLPMNKLNELSLKNGVYYIRTENGNRKYCWKLIVKK